MGMGLWGKPEGMWGLEVGSLVQVVQLGWTRSWGENDIWEGGVVCGFQCMQGAYEGTLSGKLLQILQ